jgi:hypothetical protein
MFNRLILAGCLSLLFIPEAADAQVPPFFGPGAVGVDPEIEAVHTGVLLHAQVVVSHDRRYVTLSTRPQQTQIIGFHEVRFTPAVVGGGFVGGVNPASQVASFSGAAPATGVPTGGSVLEQRGMTRIHPGR